MDSYKDLDLPEITEQTKQSDFAWGNDGRRYEIAGTGSLRRWIPVTYYRED